MKTKVESLFFLTLGLALIPCISPAHDVVVHEQITLDAAASAAAHSSAYNSFLNTIASDSSYIGSLEFYFDGTLGAPEGWMEIGSAKEDDKDQDAGGKRSLNHFYDPYHKVGLTDRPRIPPLPLGRDSFFWASMSNAPGLDVGFPSKNKGTLNVWSWPNARGYEWLGLTSSGQEDRQANLAHMFRGLGQVMHLLEDTTQPQHVRNEQHLDYLFASVPSPWHSHIEDFGSAHWTEFDYSLTHYTSDMLDWKIAGFTKLEDFWDRGLYRANGVSALTNDATGSQLLGLAEWSNGNFLGERALYAEELDSGDIHHFPYPSLQTSTTFPSIKKVSVPAIVESV